MSNFNNILKNVCILAHEDLPSSFLDSKKPYPEIKQYIRDTVEEVCSKFPWTFRERKFSFNTIGRQREYDLADGITPSNILENGIRVDGSTLPLDFIFHGDLDALALSAGKPSRYSVYSSKLILDPTPDDVYSVHIKYLTVNYGLNESGEGKANLELENDITILPDRYIKVIEWGAYSLYRQNFKPDSKYKFAREKFLEYLLAMQKQDGYGMDASPVMSITREIKPNERLVQEFFNPGN